MKTMKNLLLAALIGFSAMGCKDRNTEDTNTLPPATTSGANTAGCYINGVLHLPKNPIGMSAPPVYGLEMYSTSNGLYIRIDNFDKNVRLFIYIYDTSMGTGNYTINQSVGIGSPAGNENQIYLEYNNKEYLSSPNSGVLTFTKISPPYYSGTFSCTLYNKANPADKIQITNGRFDININTLNQ